MQTVHIITRNNDTWIHQDLLFQTCPTLTDEYIRLMRSQYKDTVSPSYQSRSILPNTGKAWRWASINGSFYYAYNNIPDKCPANYRSQLPPLEDLKAALKTDNNEPLQQYLLSFITQNHPQYLHCFGDCTKTQQTNLSKAAALLEACINWINEQKVNVKKYEFFNQLSAFIKKYDIKYFGENPRIIKNKFSAFLNNTSLSINGEGLGEVAITDIIKLPRANNANAAKYSDEEIRSWVLQLRAEEGLNYTNTFIIRKIKDMCALTLKPCPSDRWIGAIMEDHNTKFLTAEKRWGKRGRMSAIYRGYQPFQNALHAGDCWQIDGTRVNISAHKDTAGDKPARAFVYIIAVRDVHSGEILGWNYCYKEDHIAVLNALKMAVKEAGYLPYEMVFDKFPGHNTPQMINLFADLQQWGTKVTISSDPNVKPGLERWFGTLQTVFMQESALYYGQGVKSRRNYAHRSEEYMKRVMQLSWAAGFDWQQAVTECNRIIEAYRSTSYCQWSRKHKQVQQSPAQLHEISDKPNVIQVSAEDYTYLFSHLKVTSQMDGAGLIKKVIHGATFYYRVSDYEIYSKYRDVIVLYDLEDLSQVLLYKPGEGPIKQFLGRAYEEVPAQRYGPDADLNTIGKRKALIKEIAGYREQELEYRKTGTDDDITALLTPMAFKKHEAEAVESSYLLKTVRDEPTIDDTIIDISRLGRSQY